MSPSYYASKVEKDKVNMTYWIRGLTRTAEDEIRNWVRATFICSKPYKTLRGDSDGFKVGSISGIYGLTTLAITTPEGDTISIKGIDDEKSFREIAERDVKSFLQQYVERFVEGKTEYATPIYESLNKIQIDSNEDCGCLFKKSFKEKTHAAELFMKAKVIVAKNPSAYADQIENLEKAWRIVQEDESRLSGYLEQENENSRKTGCVSCRTETRIFDRELPYLMKSGFFNICQEIFMRDLISRVKEKEGFSLVRCPVQFPEIEELMPYYQLVKDDRPLYYIQPVPGFKSVQIKKAMYEYGSTSPKESSGDAESAMTDQEHRNMMHKYWRKKTQDTEKIVASLGIKDEVATLCELQSDGSIYMPNDILVKNLDEIEKAHASVHLSSLILSRNLIRPTIELFRKKCGDEAIN